MTKILHSKYSYFILVINLSFAIICTKNSRFVA